VLVCSAKDVLIRRVWIVNKVVGVGCMIPAV